MIETRFNTPLETVEQAVDYLVSRSKQLLNYATLDSIHTHEWGVNSYWTYNKKKHQSIVLLESYQGKGIYKTLITHPILTTHDCNINSFLWYIGIEFDCLILPNSSKEYTIVDEYYGNKKTNRSGVYFMNHIDEGLYILNKIKASKYAKNAYSLHPIVQGDEDLVNNITLLDGIDMLTLVNVMEYRSVANDYLSTRDINDISEIRLSPLKDVNDMLIADKIQNYKDFQLYHKDTHPRSKELTQYFENWLEKLEITKEFYDECFSELTKKIDYV